MKKRFLEAQIKAANGDQGSVRVIASTAAVDRQGESIDPNGWDFSNFLKNPQLLWSHDAYALPIGKVLKVWIENGLVMADTIFAEAENPFAATVAKLVRGGFINAVSVGFMPTDVDQAGNVMKQELLELSFVNIPANQEALVVARGGADADMIKEFRVMETKALESARHIEKKDLSAVSDMVSGIQEHCASLTSASQKMADCCEAGDETGCSDCMNEIDMYMKQMTDMMETMRSTMSGKSLAEVRQKSGRELSEKNRNEIRLMVDACKQAADSGSKLLDATTPPEKKGDAPIIKAEDSARAAHLRALRIADKAIEILIQGEKEAIAAEAKGGVKT